MGMCFGLTSTRIPSGRLLFAWPFFLPEGTAKAAALMNASTALAASWTAASWRLRHCSAKSGALAISSAVGSSPAR